MAEGQAPPRTATQSRDPLQHCPVAGTLQVHGPVWSLGASESHLERGLHIQVITPGMEVAPAPTRMTVPLEVRVGW